MMDYKYSALPGKKKTQLVHFCTLIWYQPHSQTEFQKENKKNLNQKTQQQKSALASETDFQHPLQVPLGCLRNNRCKWVTFESTAFPAQLMQCENPSEAQQTYPWASCFWALPVMIHFTILYHKEKTRQPPTGCITEKSSFFSTAEYQLKHISSHIYS